MSYLWLVRVTGSKVSIEQTLIEKETPKSYKLGDNTAFRDSLFKTDLDMNIAQHSDNFTVFSLDRGKALNLAKKNMDARIYGAIKEQQKAFSNSLVLMNLMKEYV